MTQNKILNQNISIDLGALIGQGSTGDVYHGIALKPQPTPIAIKVIPLKQINNQVTSYLLQCQLQALKTVSKYQSNSIVRLEDIIVVDEHCYIAMELLEGGTLKQYIEHSKIVEEEKALEILHHLVKGYTILKDHGIVHRDLKPDNIIFKEPQTFSLPKIIDFGYCQNQSISRKPNMFYNVGSPRYMSPQAYQDNLYTEKSDIWSLGVTFYEMLTGTTFDKGKTIVESFQLLKKKGIPISASFSDKTKRLLQGMLMFSPTRRFGCHQILMEFEREDTLKPQSLINPEIQDCFVQKSTLDQPINQKRKPQMATVKNKNSTSQQRSHLIEFKTPNKQKEQFEQIPTERLNPSISEKNLHFRHPQQIKVAQRNFADNSVCQPVIRKPYLKNRQNVSISMTQNSFHFGFPSPNVTKIISSPALVKEVNPRPTQRMQNQVPQRKQYALFGAKKTEYIKKEFLNFSERVAPSNISFEMKNHQVHQVRNEPVHINHNEVIRRQIITQFQH